ncbi:glycosyltransferase family 2 protein [Thermosipho ferrireducens]|uniref:Glycosyltransferase family 2 protein n=1 Tax=Thermosipho ferrireducens TaxID=2571116 RepID=A0ABX7S8B9_9BACT|nr:glycosyltransferase [Thermosipho ferrireducens]QTA38844.1 glycosyltransferase family 2 protein [Thermosipho ferrireducens]
MENWILYVLYNVLVSLIIVLLGKYKNEKRTNYLHENRNPDYNPLVSVVIPTWNEEEVIENTIKTVMKSSYGKIEVIVIDDNSTDMTYEIAKKLEKDYDNLVVVKKQGVRGKPQSINEAMKIAKGEIILFLDADARIPENYISSHIFCFSNPNVDMIFTNFESYNFRFRPVFIVQEIYFNFVKAIFYSNLFVRMIFMGNGLFFRRKLIEKLLPIDPQTLVDDFSMATKLSKMKVKEYYSTYPYIEIQYALNFKDLWKQHKRWYVGGFREMFKKYKEGNKGYLFLYLFVGFIVLLPVLSLIFDILFGLHTFTFVSALLFGIYALISVSSFDSRKMGLFSLFYAILYTPVMMGFEFLVLLVSLILGPFNKVKKWHRVERDRI